MEELASTKYQRPTSKHQHMLGSGGYAKVERLIDGIRLLDYIDRNVVDKHLHLTEARMVATAAPLLETLCKLHDSAGIAHMDVKPENILLTPAEDNAWNRLRLIDFGLSAKSDSGAKDVVPAGSSLPYAAPEVLHALKLATQVPQRSQKVNGAAADMWSAGCTLYDMLTGDPPFDMWDFIDTPFKHWWQRYKEAQKVQRSWTKAVLLAEATQTPAEHPILSQVRACSTTPEAAVSFFTAILHPKPSARLTSLQALDHPYLKQCVHQMQDDCHPPPLDPPCSWEERLHQDCPKASASRNSMLRGLSTVGKAAGLAGFAVLKSVAKAVKGKRQHDISQYFPTYTHPKQDSDLLTSTPQDKLTAVIRNPGLSVIPQQSTEVDTSDAGMDEVVRALAAQSHAAPLQRYDVSAAAMGLSQQRVAAAYKAVNEQRPMPAARHQFRAPASKAKKEMPFDPLRRPGARLNRHLHYPFSARIGRSAPDADSGPQQAPDAAVAVVAAGISAAPRHAEAQLPIIAAGSTKTAKAAVFYSTEMQSTGEVCTSTAAGQNRLPAASTTGQAEPVSTEQMSLPTAQGADHAFGGAAGQSGAESLQQGYTATAVGGSLSAVLASGNAGAESTRQVTSGTAAAANTTGAQHSSANAAAPINTAASVNGLASDSMQGRMLPMAAEACGLTLAQQNLRSHQIELLPEDEEDFNPVSQQLQELPTYPMPPLENVGGSVRAQSQTQPEGVQRQAVTSLCSATEQDSDIADAFLVSGEGEVDVDREDDAYRDASSNTPALYIEDMPIAREEEQGAGHRKGSWLRRSAGAFGKMGKGFALTGAVAGTAFLAAACRRRQLDAMPCTQLLSTMATRATVVQPHPGGSRWRPPRCLLLEPVVDRFDTQQL
ncbi:MAG: CPK related kinase 1 [Trebouxia sp. A1-2]|nr:MAG: CPK related kinase 1 [Trebouxia sp. A1-2]